MNIKLYAKFSIKFIAKLAFSIFLFLSFHNLIAQGVIYNGNTDVTTIYQNCTGRITIKLLFLREGSGVVTNLDLYYKNNSGGYVKILDLQNSSNGGSTFSDMGNTFWFAASNGASFSRGFFNNNGNDHTVELIWNNPPADIVNSGNPIYNLATEGTFAGFNWARTDKIVQLPILTPPAGLFTSDGVYCDRVKLDWTLPNSFPCGFSQQVYRNNQIVATIGATANTYDDYSSGSGNHNYTVRAIHTPSNSPAAITTIQSNPSQGSKRASVSAPSGITASDYRCDGKIAINWSYYNNNPINFKVYRANSPTGTFGLVGSVDGGERSYEEDAPQRTISYYYKVATEGICGETLSGNSYDGASPTVPVAPTGVSASPSTSTITVSWNYTQTDITGFVVERSSQSGTTYEQIDNPSARSYVDGNVSPCVNYTYKVRAKNNCAPSGTASTNTFTTRIFPVISNSFNGTTNKLKCSKGYYSNLVQLEWSTVNVDVLTSYRVYRKVYGSTSDSTLIGSAAMGEGVYVDNNAITGVLYKYTLIGVLNCAGFTLLSNPTEDIGFRRAFGTVSGQITYDGGIALKGAKVRVAPTSLTSNSVGASMLFNGSNTLNVPVSTKLTFTSGATLEAWFRPNNVSGTKELIRLNSGSKSIVLSLIDNKISLLANNGSSTRLKITTNAQFNITQNNYNQVSAILRADSMFIYVNGIVADSLSLSGFSYLPLNNSSIVMGNAFSGNLDEVRFYNYPKPRKDIDLDFARRVSPEDEGLVAYYTFDENITNYNGFFDYSKQGTVFNENHGTISGASFSSTIPTNDQLSFASFTDENGFYVVTFITFVGGGELFRISPAYLTHSFTPVVRIISLSEGASVINQQDFIDNSSFDVSGDVFYYNSSCPAEGIYLTIDGEKVVRSGEAIATDQFGRFAIKVPVGNHIIRAEKDGHIFSEGRFPSTGLYDFQNVTDGIHFIDSTLIKIVGRAVGGAIEANKKIGLKKSVNNIGKTRIHFKSQLGNGCSRISITTNDTTGEYTAYLPPLIYTVDTLKVLTNLVANFGTQSILDLTKVAGKSFFESDTTYISGTSNISRIDSTSYNIRRDFITYNTPQLTFARIRNKTLTDSSFIGESQIINGSDTIQLLPTSQFPYPIFYQFKEYSARVYAYDIYTNYDKVPPVQYKVPLDGTLKVYNSLGSQPSSTSDSSFLEVRNGVTTYTFRGGTPNLTINNSNPSQSFTKSMQAIFYTAGNTGVRFGEWLPNPGNTPFRGYLFGGRTRGTNFVTSGPQKVDLILRDPPGTASSSTWAKNTNYTTIKRYSNLNTVGGSFMGTVYLGAKWEKGVALGALFALESEIGGSAGFGVTKETTTGTNGELLETMSSNISISTGGGSDQVGAQADILFGHSTNYKFGLADNLMLVSDAECSVPGTICGSTSYNGYKFGIKSNLSVDPRGINTVFAYTVGEIEDILIPNLQKVRNRMIVQSKKANGTPKYIVNFTDDSDPNYEKKFASNNDDPIWGTSRSDNNPLTQTEADKSGPSYTFRPDRTLDIDSVRFYNSQIRLWKEALAKNEKEKYEAFALNVGNILNSGTNTSIGKASITREFAATRSKEETTQEEVYLAHDEAFGFKAISGGSGIEFAGSLTLGGTDMKDEGSSADSTVTIGYTLNDGDDGDLISVDIVNPGTGNGHLFRLTGGQTSCPFEGKDWAHYYKPSDTISSTTRFEDEESVQLSEGTAQRHVPTIQIPQPVKFNVPADQPATFILQLGNQSESDDEQEYDLRVIEVTNPNGAVLTIDGLDPNRAFTVPYATNISKTLSIRRGTEYYDYDSILLVLKSPCDDDIVDSVYVSVHFIPTCTSPLVYNPGDKWTLNTSFKDTMNVVISGYDYNFGGFKNISFQYKPSSSSRWNILETFHKVPDSTQVEIPTLRPYIEYAWTMRQLPDGPYDIRAVSTCSAPGHPDAVKESEVSSGLADRVNPSPFGNPSPADGILSPNDEIQIQFNEPVDNASLSFQNFDIRGVLNGSALQNTASLFFDGDNDFVEIPTGLNLTKKSFSLELWARRKALGTEQVIFSQGIDSAQYMAIGFDASNRFYFRIGNEKVRANIAMTDTLTFHHYTVSYNFDQDMCQLYLNGNVSNTGNTTIYNNYEGGGKTFIGKLAQNNGNFYSGNLRDFRLWAKTRTSVDILSSINQSLKGTEAGITANWRFDEANGTEAKDYVRSRHATIKNAVWQISPKGRSYRINNEPLAVSASDLAFSFETDFTIEFWFKGANTPDKVALFSNGRGDSTDVNPGIKWSIEKDSIGRIFVKHRGLNFEAVSDNYFDGNWHHFALVMQRSTSIAAFVDGNLQKSTYPAEFKEFGGDKLWLGARGYQNITTEVLDRKFNGYMDEVRIWNSARSQTQVNRDRVNRLAGTETGLVFYLPFETYTLNLGVPILTPSVLDMKNSARVITGATALGSGLSDETPTIKLQRPIQSINFNYSVNQDKIILTPTTLPELIENVTLDVTVKDVYDLNGNKMQSPKTWIAFVEKNQVKWQDQEFEFNKKAGEALTFTTNIVNSGGAIKQYNIQNLPVWLTANFPSGTISPNSFKTITFTIDPNVNIGNYENEVQLLTDFGYPDGLLIKLKVFSVVPSTWTVNPGNFQNSMSIVGQIRINNVISTNPDDKLAVFVDGVCRGISGLQYYPQIDRYYAFLNVFSNVSQGETLEFKIWNAGEGKIHSDVTPQIQFLTNGQIGTISNPQVFNASDKLTRYIPLATGWNWISFNLNMKDSNDINKLFRKVNSGNGDIFRSQTMFADYSVLNGWAGSIANPMVGVKPEISYRLRSSVVDTLAITGVEIDPTTRPIRIDSGWNWLGFVSQRNLSISEAFSSLTATSGDLIKSQNQFALYDVNIGWVGSLTALIPNKGYMYRAGASGNFAYPKSAMFGKKAIDINTYNSNYFKFDATKFEKNMSAVIDAGACNNALSNGRLSLGAYSNGELRGVTKVSTLDNGKNIYFLNISSNTDNENISFKLLDELNGKTYELLGDLNFDANKLVGSIPSPFALKTSGSFNCDDFNTSLSNGLNVFVYPNPFSSNIVLNIQGINASKVQVQIVDITGKAVDNFEQLTLGNNAINIDWNPSDRGITLNQGAYFIEVLAGDQVVRAKVLKF